jgi:MSHA pilin protein MshC
MPAAPTTPLACRRSLVYLQGRAGCGYTMVELVVVMIVVGIMAATAMTRFFSNKGFDAVAYADRISGMLRYGQKLAIAQNRQVFVALNGNSVSLCYDAACSPANRVLSPSGSNSKNSTTQAQCASTTWECEAPPGGVAYNSAVTSFYYDSLGKPFAAGDALNSAISTFNTLTIHVTGDSVSHDVIVEIETGYVH